VPGEPRGALAVRMVIGDGRKRSHSSSDLDAPALVELRAGAGGDIGRRMTPGPARFRPEAALRRHVIVKARARTRSLDLTFPNADPAEIDGTWTA
jgi:hypothetical protein